MTIEDDHTAWVVEFQTGARDHKAGQSQAECVICGKFGPVCDIYEDALAIATRHTEIQGFER